MGIWFTSDTHFNHARIIELGQRPFDTLDEMETLIIENWSRCVRSGDLIYHLGDFALTWGKKDQSIADKLLGQLPGNKILVAGNHDRKEVLRSPRWSKVCNYYELKKPYKIVLCHYPMREWRNMQRGSWMLHGHSHGTLIDRGGKIMDVGVDGNGYAPVHIDTVSEYMKNRDVAIENAHHGLDRDES